MAAGIVEDLRFMLILYALMGMELFLSVYSRDRLSATLFKHTSTF